MISNLTSGSADFSAIDQTIGYKVNSLPPAKTANTSLFCYCRPHSYTSILLTPSYRVTERETVQGVAKAAVRDFARLVQEGVCKEGQILLLMADGTHKNKSNTSMTGPWFLDYQHGQEIVSLIERYGYS